VMVVGHYGCAGVQAALEGARVGLADNWLRHIQDVRDRHQALLGRLDEAQRALAMCELNVIEQVANVCQTTVVADAWARGQALTVHGWVYGLHDGLLQDLRISVSTAAELGARREQAVQAVAQRVVGLGAQRA
jgi:carbonic anhydrase